MRKRNWCRTAFHKRKGMPINFVPENLKLKTGDITGKMKGGTSAISKTRGKYILSLACTRCLHQVIMWMKKGMHQNFCA
jgi:hypothetical protein